MASMQLMSEIKIEKLCRTCLSKDNELQSLFDVFNGTASLDFIVTAITGIKISKGDGLPSTICIDCKKKAIKAYDFKKKSHEADISLKDIIKKEKNENSSQNKPKVNDKTDVKIEHISANDNDDDNYSDADYDVPLSHVAAGVLDTQLDKVKIKKESVPVNRPSFQCKNCLQDFSCPEKLQHHEQTKCIKVEFDDTKGTFCPLCGKSYDGAESLSKHLWELHAEVMGPKKRGRPKKMLTSTILDKLSENGFFITTVAVNKFECSFCSEQYKTKEDLDTHLLEHKDTKVLCCIGCKKMFLKRNNFEEHSCIPELPDGTKQNEGLPEESNNKTVNFLTEVSLQELLEPNCDEENLNFLKVCSACSAVFLSEDELTNHRDSDHPEFSLRCNLCAKNFATVKSAARHRAICKKVERNHKCDTCGLKFAYEISLNKHILRQHQGQTVSISFDDSMPKEDDKQYRKEVVTKRTQMRQVPAQKQFQCDICEKKFSRKDNLRSHKRIHDPHRVVGPSNTCLCLYCGRSFSNSSNLIVHMRRHTGEKPYKCDFCGKGFPRSSDLRGHRRSHTGEKPCICRVCGKAFSRSNKLTRHMRVHTGVRPYKCTYCEKAFSQSNDLTLHIRRHTGDRPYICEVCGDRFIQGTALQNHRRAHGHFPNPPTEVQPPVQGIQYTLQNVPQTNQ